MTAAGAEISEHGFSTLEADSAMVEVPDSRLNVLAEHIETLKVIPATVKVVDIAGLTKGSASGKGLGNRFLGALKECDALLHVVRCFDNPRVHRDEPLNPEGDLETVELELVLADLETVQRNVERVAKKARLGDRELQAELAVLEKAVAILEDGRSLRSESWTSEERGFLRPLFLLTIKDVLVVANVGEDDLDGAGDAPRALAVAAANRGLGFLVFCGELEHGLRSMDPDERAIFQKEFGLTEPGLDRLIRSTYELLTLQTFFTAGEKEIRAWTVCQGATAPTGAGEIHSDFVKGFIRAEIYSVNDLVEHRSEAAIKAAGQMRTEGKGYVLQEGDVCHFLVGR